MSDGKLIFDTKLNESGLTKGIGGIKGIISKLSRFTALAGTIMSASLVVVAKKAIDLASDLQEVQNVVDVTFEESASTINAWAKSASNAYGLTELQAKQYTSTMGAMLKSMGLTDDATLEMSINMAGLTADMASFYNLDHEEAFEKIRSGISGETEPLKQLGINMSVANLEAYALAQGITTSYNSMTQAEQATLRYQYLMSVTADAQGDFARTSEGYANQTRVLSNNITSLATKFGEKLLPAVTDVVAALNEKLSSDAAEDAINSIGDTVASAAKKFVDFAITVIDNGNKIVAAAKGVAAAFVMTKAITGIMALKKAYVELTVVTAASTLGQKLFVAAGAALQTVVGMMSGSISVLTGRITLAIIAQQAWNAVTAIHPLGWLAIAIGAVVTGLLVYSAAVNDAKSDTELLEEQIIEASEKFDEQVESLRRLKDAQDEAMESGLSEMNYLASLKTELDGLVDSNGRVKEGYEGRAQFIVDELSEAMGLEISLVDGVITKNGELGGSYEDLGAEIDKYMEKRRAQIILETQEESYKAAVAGMDSLLSAASESYAALLDARTAYDAVMNEKVTAANAAQHEIDLEAARYTLALAEEKWAGVENDVKTAVSTIEQYEGDYAAFAMGNYDAIIQSHQMYANGYKDMTEATKSELQEQIAAIQTNLTMQEQLYEDTGNDIYKGNTEILKAMLEDYETQLANMTSTVEEGGLGQQQAWEQVALNNLAAAASQNGEGGGMEKAGEESANRYRAGIEGGTPGVTAQAENMADEGVAGASSAAEGFHCAGDDSANSFGAGIRTGAPVVNDAGTYAAQQGKAGAGSQQTGFHSTGSGASIAMGAGIRTGAPAVRDASVYAAQQGKTGAGSVSFVSVGGSFISGIVAGIGTGLETLKQAARNAVIGAYNAAKTWLDSRSPSKKTAKGLGLPFSQGISVGIEGDTPNLMASARKSAINAVSAFRAAINSSQLSTSLSLAPVAAVSGAAPTATGVTSLTQNFYSPKALAESEISLETRNIVRRSKWELK